MSIYTEPPASSSEKAYQNQLKEFRKNILKKTVDRSENEDYLYTENSDIDQKDMVNHPKHYNKGKYETYDVIVDTLGKYEAISYCQGNILKYIIRMWNKNKPLQDAEKAEWYLKAMIKLLKETKGVNW